MIVAKMGRFTAWQARQENNVAGIKKVIKRLFYQELKPPLLFLSYRIMEVYIFIYPFFSIYTHESLFIVVFDVICICQQCFLGKHFRVLYGFNKFIDSFYFYKFCR